jgi:flagellar basal-body rod modification protein FlgD
MQVAGTNATTPNQTESSTISGTGKTTLNYDNFLKLLVAQLKNQDPTNPSDPTAFVSHLASFSSVEQQVNMNSKLDALLTQTELSQGASVIGRTVTSADGSISGSVAQVEITSTGATAILTDGQTLVLGAGVVIS